MVNSKNLQDNFEEFSTAFEDSLMELNDIFCIKITNKCHIIISHLADYFKRNGKSLLLTSDQTVESANQCFDISFNIHGYFRKHNDPEEQGAMLLRSVLAFNSYHIGKN